MNWENRGMKFVIHRFISLLLTAAILAVVVILEGCSNKNVNNGEITDGSSSACNVYSDGTGISWIDGAYTSKTIQSGDDAIESLEDVSQIYGIEDPNEEYVVLSEKSNAQNNYYRLQQYSDGLEVYGYQLIVCTNADGTAQSITGSYVPNITVNTQPGISGEDACNIVLQEALVEEVNIGDASAEGLIIYVPQDDYGCFVARNATLAYKIATGLADVFVDANTGEILGVNLHYVSESATGKGRTLDGSTVKIATTKENGEYILKDGKRNLTIYDAAGDDVSDFLCISYMYDCTTRKTVLKKQEDGTWEDTATGMTGITCVGNIHGLCSAYSPDGNLLFDRLTLNRWFNSSSHPNGFEYIRDSDNKWDNPEAVSLMYYAEQTYDYFSSKLNHVGYNGANAPMQLYYGMSEYNAISCYGGMLLFNNSLISQDVVSHEYTHSVERGISCMSYADTSESSAVMEAYSDIFGELVENDSEWVHSSGRNIANPSASGNPSYYKGDNWYYADNLLYHFFGDMAHTNSTVISHAAYLMNQNGISMDDLAKIWYGGLYYLNSNANFKQCRMAVIASAKAQGYSNKTIEIIRFAFDDVGVFETGDAVISPNAEIHVFSASNQECSTYSFEMVGSAIWDGKNPIWNTVLRSDVTDGVVDLSQSSDNPAEGEWTITISCEADGKVYRASKVVTVAENGMERLDINTDFPDSCVNNSIDYAKIYEAYLEQLLSNEEEIQEYIWQMGYYGFGEMTEETTPRPINISDINGDDIPELIYISIHPDNPTSTNLHIYEYIDGNLVELYTGGWDYYVGGGFGYVLFKTSDDSSLYAFYSEGDAWIEDNYDVFKMGEGGGLELQQLYMYYNHEGSGSERDIHYYADEIECDETTYTSGKNEIQEKIIEILMMSKGCDQAIGADSVYNSAMTFEEAIDFLKQKVGAKENTTENTTGNNTTVNAILDWNSTYECFVLEYQFMQRGSEDYGTETDFLVGLYDLDKDGTPELIIHNGYAGRALRCAYCYAYEGNEITYAGICPTEAYYLKNDNYGGLLGRYSDSTEAYWSYYYKSGNTIASESVYTEIISVDSTEYYQTTTDWNLFNACIDEKTYYDKLHTIDEISSMGWDSFVDACLN